MTGPWRVVAAVILAVLPATATADGGPPSAVVTQDAAPGYCVWPAVGGALAGVTVSYYGVAGGYALATGSSMFELGDTPGELAAVVAVETVGLVGGAVAGCAIWGDEDRWFPTAASTISGGIVGGAAGAGLAYLAITGANIDANTDNPVASALLILAGTAGGAVAGGYLGYRLDNAVRGRPGKTRPAVVLYPHVSRDSVFVGAALTF